MADSDVVLRFVSTKDSNVDTRTFCVFQALENGYGDLELYRFSHPLTGHTMGTTTFTRKNLDTIKFETAGHIEWFSSFNAMVWFGVDEVSVKDLRRIKNGGQSRRFKASSMEYKWRLQENGNDMYVSIFFAQGRMTPNTSTTFSVSTPRGDT
ncbi:hypothetical protein JVU11DRAFT_1391 [Chiua virens]|nr:hypothetical protein JVU11DRAFT_1391 [Chiua virens]